jgi:serpin B
LPDEVNDLSALERRVTPELLAECAKLDTQQVALWLPKLKIEPPLLVLSQNLKALGMKTAFDDPSGSANFDRMAPRRPDDYLYISEVFHKTFLALDEKGTEAAAATAVAMFRATAVFEKPKPIEVRVDRPFLFAIQHRPSGACLFLGKVTDPR